MGMSIGKGKMEVERRGKCMGKVRGEWLLGKICVEGECG